MFKKVQVIFILTYLAAVLAMMGATYASVKKSINEDIAEHYAQHFSVVNHYFQTFYDEISADLLTLAADERVRTRDDSQFTSFLNANPDSFEYHYSDQEQAIITLFYNVLVNHPQMNSVYMGRENGSFVRAVPRTSATQYDPRERPWYQSAIENPGTVQITPAYSSVTNSDVNIAFVVTLQDENGIAYGVVGIDVTLSELSEQMKKQQLTYDGFMEFVDASGVILISPIAEDINTNYTEDESYQQVGIYENVNIEKNDVYYKMTYDQESWGGHFVAYAPVSAVEAQLKQTLLSQLLVSMTILLFMEICGIIFIEFYIRRPANELIYALKLSYATITPQKIHLHTNGEFRQFESHYNQLVEDLHKREIEVKKIRNVATSNLSYLALLRDQETGLHLLRVSKYVELLAHTYNELFPEKTISESKIEYMVECAPLHDIGKVGIHDNILQKKGKLTPSEFEDMKKHAFFGKIALQTFVKDIHDEEFIRTSLNLVYSHHERWDGTGYPERLVGDAIPIEAQIMALADTYDAITSKRVYKPVYSHEVAIESITAASGTQFNPDLVSVFLKVEQRMKEISVEMKDHDLNEFVSFEQENDPQEPLQK